jgi:RNA polymerase sigma-70 factor (sigma-E family)
MKCEEASPTGDLNERTDDPRPMAAKAGKDSEPPSQPGGLAGPFDGRTPVLLMFLLVTLVVLPAVLRANGAGVIAGVIVTGGCLLFVRYRGLKVNMDPESLIYQTRANGNVWRRNDGEDYSEVPGLVSAPAPCPAAPDVPGSTAGHLASAADNTVTALYVAQYRSLVRTAAMLVGDVGTAEEVVQDCFVSMHRAFWRLRDTDKALRYLRRSVVNRSRSVVRHRIVADRYLPKPEPDMPSAEQGAIALLAHAEVISALRLLPMRQREAIVLRFYLDLSEEQVASAMNISRGAVKAHTARAKSALRSVLEQHR